MTAPNINNTRQEVVRVDYDLNDRWHLTGRYTHDLSETRELQGLFFGTTSIPGTAATDFSALAVFMRAEYVRKSAEELVAIGTGQAEAVAV